MKKVAIITILDNTNYGTYLQALATGYIVQNFGYAVEIIRYTRPCQTPKGFSMRILHERGFLRWINRCVLHNHKKTWELRERDFVFLKKYLPVTHEYTSYKALCKDIPLADIYLTGSDQVWNSYYNMGIDKSFYLEFAPKGAKRIAYASSIGMDTFAESEKEIIAILLRKYAHITVREKQAVDLLNSINIESKCVLDPTLLLTKNQWSKVAEKYSFFCDERFLLVYSVESKEQSKLIKYYAKCIAQKLGLKIYHISYSGKDKTLDYPDRTFNYATPDLFLNLMLRASFVVVSSFHGTAFSINFNKQFLSIAPARFNSRVYSLLEQTNLLDRLVKDNHYSIDNLQEIDYDKVNNVINRERSESLELFKQILEN